MKIEKYRPTFKTIGLQNLKGLCGVYKIECVVTGKYYIGSSNNLHRRRREHYRRLSNGKHESPRLQNAWSKYGAKNFNFMVVEL